MKRPQDNNSDINKTTVTSAICTCLETGRCGPVLSLSKLSVEQCIYVHIKLCVCARKQYGRPETELGDNSTMTPAFLRRLLEARESVSAATAGRIPDLETSDWTERAKWSSKINAMYLKCHNITPISACFVRTFRHWRINLLAFYVMNASLDRDLLFT